tara:strand:- start:893 stop:1072 length:180 start_codon:yes stop_codon:yes gene_type:complete
MMVIYVLVEVANIKDFMRCTYGIFIDKVRMFIQKVICFCMAVTNKINYEFGEKKKCTKN